MRKLIWMLITGFSLVSLMSCSEDDDADDVEVTSELYEITSYTENDITVTIYSTQEELIVGYNDLTVTFESTTETVEDQSVTVSPLMDMTSMTHACPIEYIDNVVTDGSIEVALVFVMASGDMGTWTVEFEIGGTSVTVPVTVNAPEYAKLVSFTSDVDEVSYYLALIEPSDPETGQNELEIAVYKKESMMSWPAVDGLTFEMTPWMPSMEHSSSNNTAPVFTQDGHYEGIVTFSMTGDWEIQLTMMEDDGETVLGEPYFELYFQ